MKRNNNAFLTFIVVFLTAFLSSVGIILKNQETSTYWFVALLPLFFCLIILINYRVFAKSLSMISIMLVMLCYYMRMVIIPFVFVYSDYSSLIINHDYSNYIIYAVLLSIYEFFIVTTIVNCFDKKKIENVNNNDLINKNEVNNTKANKYVSIIIFILLIVVVLAFIKYPQFQYYFRFIFESNINKIDSYNINSRIMKETIPSITYWTIIYLIDILQILLPIVFINIIKKMRIYEGFKFILSISIILIVVLICTPETARSIIIAFSLCFILIKLYPNKKRFLITSIIVLLFPSIIFGLFIKSGSSYFRNDISNILNAYFSGVSNIATSFLIPNRPSLLLLFNDMIHSVPFVNAFFRETTTSTVLYNNLFYNSAGRYDQIIPMISQSMCYFGFLLAPIISYFSVKISLLVENKYNCDNDIYKIYFKMIIILYFAIAPVVYNFSIIFSVFFKIIIPCFIIINFRFSKYNFKKQKLNY